MKLLLYCSANLPWLAEELVLHEDRESEHDETLNHHGTKVLPHHFPAEGVLETVFTWQRMTSYSWNLKKQR